MLTVADLCERYGVSADTVRSWITSDQLEAINVAPAGSKRSFYRITEEALREFERGRRTRRVAIREKIPAMQQIV